MSEILQKPEDKKIKQDKLIYTINEDENTASIIKGKALTGDVIIQRLINYESKEYIVTTIAKNALSSTYITSIKFPIDTEIRTIEKSAFIRASIESISIPASLVNLEDGWCESTNCLINITVSPNNPRYSVYEDKFIIGKSSSESENYDVLVFCVRNVEKVTIPSFIKHIGAYAFDSCKKLKNIEIPINSELQTIEKYAFKESSIENFQVPPHVTYIGKSAFMFCDNLKKFDIPTNSELKKIGKKALLSAPIESIFIPSNLIEIKEFCFESTRKIIRIGVSPNNPRYSLLDGKILIGKSSLDINEYDSIVYCIRNIESITIPSFIKYIGDGAFSDCKKLCNVELSEDSELRTFGYRSFQHASLISIKIPPHVTQISGFSFSSCRNLQTVEISNNSELELIDEYAFSGTSIKSFNVPVHVKRIGKAAFFECNLLRNFEIPKNSELQKIDDSIIGETSIRNITFPSNLVDVGEIAAITPYLCKIDVDPNNHCFKVYENKMVLGKSNPESNEFDVLFFCFKDTKFIRIPKFIKIINNFAFNCCRDLYTVEFEENSELEEINQGAFYGSSIESFTILPKITQICDNTFEYCENLKKIDISANSQLKILGDDSFCHSSIESFTIPSHLTIIGSSSFSECDQLRRIDFEKNSELQIIGNDAFFESEIESFIVPKTVKRICEGAFAFCNNFQIIEFDENSEIESIASNAFIESNRLVLMIPVKLSEHSFHVFSMIDDKGEVMLTDSDEE